MADTNTQNIHVICKENPNAYKELVKPLIPEQLKQVEQATIAQIKNGFPGIEPSVHLEITDMDALASQLVRNTCAQVGVTLPDRF